ncbi:MAG: hypothetical protein WC156_12700 [Pedobacter sp.]
MITASMPDKSYDGNFGELDLFAGFPCPLKAPMETELNRLLENDISELRRRTQTTFVEAWQTTHPDKQIP